MIDYKIEKLEKFSDQRGDLIVFLKKSELDKKVEKFGQIYFVTFIKKGVVRGNHYHKKWREWFGIIKGRVNIVLENVKTKERKSFHLDANSKKYIRLELGPYVAHAIKSLSDYAAILNYTTSEWSKEDSFYYKLL